MPKNFIAQQPIIYNMFSLILQSAPICFELKFTSLSVINDQLFFGSGLMSYLLMIPIEVA
ncbi:hypothetical protein BV372_00200 [Nostoc sp. T09]|nr:hypothetical protein BV372_00200 [Nostoc sp. T09]